MRWPPPTVCIPIRSCRGQGRPGKSCRLSFQADERARPRLMTRGTRDSTSRSGPSKSHATGSTKPLACPLAQRRPGVAPHHAPRRVRRPCQWLGVNRARLSDQPVDESVAQLPRRRWREAPSTRGPLDGVLRLTAWLRHPGPQGHGKRGRRCWRQMGVMAVYPTPRLSQPGAGAPRYAAGLTGVKRDRPDHIWATAMTCRRWSQGVVDLVAILDG